VVQPALYLRAIAVRRGSPLTHIPCSACAGTGRIPLTGEYAVTLDLLRKQRKPLCGAALAKLAGCSGEAMCNRLVRLEALGLARRVRFGRMSLWTAVQGGSDAT
jgi:hypothetical protein